MVDHDKVEVIAILPPPNCVRVVWSFLGHATFYRRFVKDFSKMVKHLNDLLAKEATFEFSDECLRAFNLLKEKLVSAFVVVAPNWSLPFELMCDASDSVVGVVLGQRKKRCSIRSTRLVEHLMTPKIITPQ